MFIVLSVILTFFVAYSLAVFLSATVFNQDVSKWNTEAVIDMGRSKCNLFLSLWQCGSPFVLRVSSCQFSPHTTHHTPHTTHHTPHTTHHTPHVPVLFLNVTFCCCVGCCGCWLSFFLSLHPKLSQCFIKHLRSIRTCPNGIQVQWQLWNAVSVLSLPLCGHGAFSVVVCCWMDNSRFVGSQVSHVFVLCVCMCGGFGPSFLWCTLLSSCSVWSRICVQSGRVHLEYGGGDNYGIQ